MRHNHAAFWERHRTELWDRVFQADSEVAALADGLEERPSVVVARQGLLAAAFGVGVSLVKANASDEQADFLYWLHEAVRQAVETDYWLRLLTVVAPREGWQTEVAGLLARYGTIVTLLRRLAQHVADEPAAVARHTRKGPRL